jgi:8-oxo-dGTP pyrophosphatase MutT (NUDIX family)
MSKHGDLQFAALPWRIDAAGRREVMLLTSRETRRWVIPKGWPMKDRKPAQAASQEALEEAGLIGEIVGKRPLGNYHYQKRLPNTEVLTEVLVYSFYVEKQLGDWPERKQRETRWFNATEAAALVDEGGLALIIERLAEASIQFVPFRKHRSSRPRSGPISITLP